MLKTTFLEALEINLNDIEILLYYGNNFGINFKTGKFILCMIVYYYFTI